MASYQEPKLDYIVEVKPGDTIELTVRENPTTGYKWTIVDAEMEASGLSSVIRLSDTEFETDKSKRGAVGVGGRRTLVFDVIGEGSGDLTLYLVRSWEVEEKIRNGEPLGKAF